MGVKRTLARDLQDGGLDQALVSSRPRDGFPAPGRAITFDCCGEPLDLPRLLQCPGHQRVLRVKYAANTLPCTTVDEPRHRGDESVVPYSIAILWLDSSSNPPALTLAFAQHIATILCEIRYFALILVGCEGFGDGGRWI